MTPRRIEIQLNAFDVLILGKFFYDFYNKESTRIHPLHIIDPFGKPLLVEELPGDEKQQSLARIFSKTYDKKMILYIEQIGDQENNWRKIQNATQNMIDEMTALDFGVVKVNPEIVLTEQVPADKVEEELWKNIPDKENDRKILKLWLDLKTGKEISKALNLTEGRVRNRLTELRKEYGEEVVPYKRTMKNAPSG